MLYRPLDGVVKCKPIGETKITTSGAAEAELTRGSSKNIITSCHAGLPAELKHINKQRKRN